MTIDVSGSYMNIPGWPHEFPQTFMDFEKSVIGILGVLNQFVSNWCRHGVNMASFFDQCGTIYDIVIFSFRPNDT